MGEGVGLNDALGDDPTITDGQIVLPRPSADLGAGRLDRSRGWDVDVHGWPRPVGATCPRGLRGRSDDWDTRCLLVLVHRIPLGQFIVPPRKETDQLLGDLQARLHPSAQSQKSLDLDHPEHGLPDLAQSLHQVH